MAKITIDQGGELPWPVLVAGRSLAASMEAQHLMGPSDPQDNRSGHDYGRPLCARERRQTKVPLSPCLIHDGPLSCVATFTASHTIICI